MASSNMELHYRYIERYGASLMRRAGRMSFKVNRNELWEEVFCPYDKSKTQIEKAL
ncbi:MAG: hypothetical protein LBE38_01625 [Deltaproteobacteria bacterium]|jgi:hypothetical protein|nr:hypothetical protein [Deltaproteobacteria bacterium]